MAWKWLLKISGRHHQLLYDYKRNSKAKCESSLVGTHELLQLFCIGARHLCHFGASLVELERRHTLDAAGSSGLFVLIHVHLHEHDLAPCSASIAAKIGAMRWHGPHQVAVKSTTTSLSVLRASSNAALSASDRTPPRSRSTRWSVDSFWML